MTAEERAEARLAYDQWVRYHKSLPKGSNPTPLGWFIAGWDAHKEQTALPDEFYIKFAIAVIGLTNARNSLSFVRGDVRVMSFAAWERFVDATMADLNDTLTKLIGPPVKEPTSEPT